MTKDFVLKGNIVHARKMGELSVTENGYIVVRGGNVKEILHEYNGNDAVDYGSSIIMPGLGDMHVHAPQYAMAGFGLDMELLQWLKTYAFTEESKYSDAEYAAYVYEAFARALVKAGTTRACVYGTIHTDTVLLLMDILERAGITAYVGKVNMDRNAPEALCEDTEASIDETRRWLGACARFENVRPIITPRFLPACTGPLLKSLGEIAREHGLPVQSHLSENKSEVEWVRQLEPEASCYGNAYENYGLFGSGVKTIMAHCVHSTDEELTLMAENGVWMAHCPDSNSNLSSGMADVRGMLDAGVPVALGSDLAGGSSISILDVAAKAIRISKLRQSGGGGKCLTVPEAFYLATSAGAEFFGDKPGFQAGSPLHAVVINDAHMINTSKLSVPERLERAVYLSREIKIEAVYAGGNKIL